MGLIELINQTCSPFFEFSKFVLTHKDLNFYTISGSDLTYAIDNYGTGKREVKVLKWFDDFWLYKEIRLVPELKKYPNIFVTISIFQGSADDNVKSQLFRAEWDNYNDNSSVHPQPHWHIYPYKYDSKTYEDFEAYNDMRDSEVNEQGFEAQLKKKKAELIDIRYVHFAMNGKWSNNEGCVNKIQKDTELINWLSGILAHIKEQLLYVRE